MSRHRGANQLRRWELLGIISLLSPAYLYPLIDNFIKKNYRVTMAGKKTLTLGKLVSLPIKLNFIHYNNHIAHMFRKAIAHPRYFLGGHRPSETSILTISNT